MRNFTFNLTICIFLTFNTHRVGVGTGRNNRNRNIYPYIGGSFEGPGGKGIVLPGGGDWGLQHPTSGVQELDIRIHLVTDDGVAVYGTCSGIIQLTPEDWEKFGAGNLDINPIRSIGHWRFEVDGESKYAHLNQAMCIGHVTMKQVDGDLAACWAIYDVTNDAIGPHPLAKM